MSNKVELNEDEVIVSKRSVNLVEEEMRELRKNNKKFSSELEIFHGMLELGLRNKNRFEQGMSEDSLFMLLRSKREQ